MQSVGMNIAAMFIGVCVSECVCVWPGPNGKTTAHQLLFGCRSSGTMSVIRQRYTHTRTCKNPHFLVKSKKKKN